MRREYVQTAYEVSIILKLKPDKDITGNDNY